MILTLNEIEKHYRITGARTPVLRGVSLDIDEGETVSITGKSGCGKTTLLNVIAGITSHERGTIYFHDKKISNRWDIAAARRRNREIGFIFQTFMLMPQESVERNVFLPARIRGRMNREVKDYAHEIMGRLRIYKYRNTAAGRLSGGQKQRVAIARALVNRPSLILADEPTANLDRSTSHEIFDIINDIRSEGTAVLIITHKDYMHERSSRVYAMEEGILKAL